VGKVKRGSKRHSARASGGLQERGATRTAVGKEECQTRHRESCRKKKVGPSLRRHTACYGLSREWAANSMNIRRGGRKRLNETFGRKRTGALMILEVVVGGGVRATKGVQGNLPLS